MAWSVSAWSGDFISDALGNVLAVDIDGTDTLKYTLWNNSITPDKNASNDAYNAGQWVNSSNEIYSTGQWAQGGPSIVSITLGAASAKVTFDAADLASSSGATLTAFYGGMAYDSTTSNRVILFHYFGGSQTVTTGTLTLVWNANGLGYISY